MQREMKSFLGRSFVFYTFEKLVPVYKTNKVHSLLSLSILVDAGQESCDWDAGERFSDTLVARATCTDWILCFINFIMLLFGFQKNDIITRFLQTVCTDADSGGYCCKSVLLSLLGCFRTLEITKF